MQRPEEAHALLVEGINAMEAGMLKSLLDSEGIPSLAHSPDFDVIELGRAHDMTRGIKFFVPHAALQRARQILEQASWFDGEATATEPSA